ncbi:MAG TPA: hypothetical protein ACFYD4_12350 [Candidatus Wunengus sp. YC61]|uniref:hypothetical protein n=1 Tax=Candidatus Wunengus sp. YC61 TaxID=3367698 RepID=UPI004026D60B
MRGNFGGDTDEVQSAAADKYAALLEGKLTDFCHTAYPAADLKFDLSVENASGCASGFEVWIDDVDHDDEFDIEQSIKNEYDWIVHLMERSGEIYE